MVQKQWAAGNVPSFQKALKHQCAFNRSYIPKCFRKVKSFSANIHFWPSWYEFTEKLLQKGSRLTHGWKALLKAVWETATGSLLCNCVSPWNKLWRFCRALTYIFKGMVVCCNSQRQQELNTDLFSLFVCCWLKGNCSFVVSSLLPCILFVIIYLVCYCVFSCVGQQKRRSYEINSTSIFNLQHLNLNYHKFSHLFCKKIAFILYLNTARIFVFYVHRHYTGYMRVCTACFLFFSPLPHQ